MIENIHIFYDDGKSTNITNAYKFIIFSAVLNFYFSTEVSIRQVYFIINLKVEIIKYTLT